MIEKDYTKLEQIKLSLTILKKSSLEWGFFEESKYGPENDNLQVAQVAAWNNYGAGWDVPPRPFFDISVHENKKMYFNYIVKNLPTVLFTETSPSFKSIMESLGAKTVQDLQRNIEMYQGPYQQNSAWWAAQKGFNNPLQYTDTMLNSVRYKVIIN